MPYETKSGSNQTQKQTIENTTAVHRNISHNKYGTQNLSWTLGVMHLVVCGRVVWDRGSVKNRGILGPGST